MIYTKTGEYAIRAILFLARQPQDALIMSSEIAEREDIPSHYLAKILQRMAREIVIYVRCKKFVIL